MLGKKSDPSADKILEVDASFQGNLVFKDPVNLKINGYFEGMLETKGDLFIGDEAVIKGNLIARRISVLGAVGGDLSASEEIKLSSSARVKGRLKSPALIIEKGCIFNGETDMFTEPEKPHKESSPRVFFTVDELANYLSVEASRVFEWAESGEIPGTRQGQMWKFDKRKVDEWIAKGRIN